MVFRKFLEKALGDSSTKHLKKLLPTVAKINEQAEKYKELKLTLDDVKKKTEEFKGRLEKGETLEDLKVEAFALVKHTCGLLVGKKWEVRDVEKEWDMPFPFDVQLLGGLVIHEGNIAEMKTGEGKTLVCTIPVYLNALEGKGVHVVTVNDYLAHRDAEWMSGLYEALGLTVGVVVHGMEKAAKRDAYNADVTYGTNNEFGFDYLRDNMATSKEELVQRDLNYAIIDEVDSILIDEARTPLIISAPAGESTSKYSQYKNFISQLTENEHYNIDEKQKSAVLSEDGIAKMEQLMGVDNIYTEKGFEEVHHIEQALRAHACYKKDVDYMVKEGEIIIVDEFTGRLMQGRRYSNGLHQAIEAKENVEIKRESKTLATITFQNYFRLFNKLAGMTGTAMTEADEFREIYNVESVAITTNKPVIRKDLNDAIFKNFKGKLIAIATKVKELNEKGQPVLIGTISIEKSEQLSQMLKTYNIKHNVLNAKHHEKEAEIVTNAGQRGAVTIATNMAGRGTDIKLGEGVIEAGGLAVIGTERHESRRIDNQLRGRSGRQGDAGFSQFFVSMEDDLMRIFGGEKIQKTMEMLKVPDEMPIENRMISNSIESAQKKVEGHNFDIRKHVVEYDDVMNKQREIVYSRRKKILMGEDMKSEIEELIKNEAELIVLSHKTMVDTGRKTEEKDPFDYKEIIETLNTISRENNITQDSLKEISEDNKLIEIVEKFLKGAYEEKEKTLPEPEMMREVERSIYLRVIDTLWMEHIDSMRTLRERVAFEGYGQRQPIIEYKKQAYEMFQKVLGSIQSNTINTLFKVHLKSDHDHSHAGHKHAPIKKAVTNEDQIESNLDHSTNIKAKPSNTDGLKVRTIPTQNVAMGQTQPTQGTQDSTTKKGKITVIKADDTPQQIGDLLEQVGRNPPVSCGSGKKYKKCHGE